MNILFSVDENYVKYLEVNVFQILRHNPDSSINFYIFHRDIPEQRWSGLESLKKIYTRFDYHPIQVPSGIFENLPTGTGLTAHITQETYFRFALNLLPSKVKKILYMDVDIHVRGSLKELWDKEVATIAGVADPFAENLDIERPPLFPEFLWRKRFNIFRTKHTRRIGMSRENRYINCGILLINRDSMPDNLLQGLLELVSELESKGSLRMGDQDAINVYFEGRIDYLDSRFNLQTNHVIGGHYLKDEVAIVHFTGPDKPWHFDPLSYPEGPAFERERYEFKREWNEDLKNFYQLTGNKRQD